MPPEPAAALCHAGHPLYREEGLRARSSSLAAIFSFPVALALALAALTVLTVRGRFADPDLWWHLKTGELIWTTHHIPSTDVFSYTAAGHPWVAHEWLSEALMYGVYQAAGFTGLMAWQAAVASLLFILVYVVCSLYSGNAKVSLLGGLLAWLFGTIGLAIRPHLLGYLCLVLELFVIHLGRTRDRRWFWALPPLFALWVNCHGSFVLGIAVLGIFLVCSWFEFSAGSLVSYSWPASHRKILAAASVLSMAALLVNPIGPRLVLYPFDLMFNQSLNLAAVNEWQPLDLSDGRAVMLFGVAALVFALVTIRRKELKLDELLLFAVGFALALRHQRMLFVFGILAAPIMCRLLADAWDRYDARRDLPVANAVLMAGALMAIWLGFPTARELQAQVDRASPTAAVDFIRRTGVHGRMLNEYEFGGYLIWALPGQKVFIDGRCDLFDWTGVLAAYGRWATLLEDPKLLLEKYHIDYCLLSKSAPITRVLPYLPGWKPVYSDRVAQVWIRN